MDYVTQQPRTDVSMCNSCTQTIAPSDPRIRCLICHNYDLCANCAIGERFSRGHLMTHQTQVYKESGEIDGHLPVLSGNVIVYAGATSPSGPSTPYSSNYEQTSAVQPSAGHPASRRSPPPLPARPRPNVRTSSIPPVSEFQWQPFFLEDTSPTPSFITLFDDIFTHLDSSHSGLITPEAYSRFLDDQEYLPHENVCTSRCLSVSLLPPRSLVQRQGNLICRPLSMPQRKR